MCVRVQVVRVYVRVWGVRVCFPDTKGGINNKKKTSVSAIGQIVILNIVSPQNFTIGASLTEMISVKIPKHTA